MAISRCASGHFYDDKRFSECPFCSENNSSFEMKDYELTQTISRAALEDDVTVAKKFDFDDEKTISKCAALDDEKTVGAFKMKLNTEPVVGWLVCVSGKEKGRDYKIRPGRNFIGRSAKMGISIFDDAAVSRENHLSIIYEPKKNEFIAVSGNNEVIINGKSLEKDEKLAESDIIEIGETKLVFIPYCKGDRKWDV